MLTNTNTINEEDNSKMCLRDAKSTPMFRFDLSFLKGAIMWHLFRRWSGCWGFLLQRFISPDPTNIYPGCRYEKRCFVTWKSMYFASLMLLNHLKDWISGFINLSYLMAEIPQNGWWMRWMLKFWTIKSVAKKNKLFEHAECFTWSRRNSGKKATGLFRRRTMCAGIDPSVSTWPRVKEFQWEW